MKKRKGFTLIELMIVIAIIAILAAILVPNFMRARAQSQFTACQSNCKNIGTANEIYSTDNSGAYATTLGNLTDGASGAASAKYMKQIPKCSAANADTYTATYQINTNPHAYSFKCGGARHTAIVAGDYPQYSSEEGLVSAP